jgi:hypothetical protein
LLCLFNYPTLSSSYGLPILHLAWHSLPSGLGLFSYFDFYFLVVELFLRLASAFNILFRRLDLVILSGLSFVDFVEILLHLVDGLNGIQLPQQIIKDLLPIDASLFAFVVLPLEHVIGGVTPLRKDVGSTFHLLNGLLGLGYLVEQ